MADGFPLSASGFRLSADGYRLSAFGFRLSADGYRLSAFGFRLTAIGFRLSDFGDSGLEDREWRIETRERGVGTGDSELVI